MGFNPLEIINAWITAANPTEMEAKLAKERLSICLKCDFRKEVIHNKQWSAVCGKCGCPIQKKIFTNQYGSCPMNKWEEVEKKYIKNLVVKDKSII
jgi:PHP family Zn ribbon phosphoesterase